jgi:nicotinate-nucleotide adenylyltransferase
VGHLVLAQEAAAQLGLERVLLVPTGRAPHKEIPEDPGREARLEMALAAVDGSGSFEIERLEIDAAEHGEDPTYTYVTLEALDRQRDEDLVWIMGADAAVGLREWRRPKRILELARLAVAGRPGVERSAVEAVLETLGGGRAEFIEMPEIGVSSTMVRERVAAGRPIRYLVPDGVAALIEERGLYA